MRRHWQRSVLCLGALLLGIAGGVATGPTKVYADEKRGDQRMDEAAHTGGRSSGAPAPRASGVRCKLTKECQKISADMVCQKFGDHKECFHPLIGLPVGRPNT